MGFHSSADTLLVIGIHREELDFGDSVVALLENKNVDVLRIPHGISHTRQDSRFYYALRHKEIYLQLKQTVGQRYKLMIDLHTGTGNKENDLDVDLFCHDEAMLRSLPEVLSTIKGVRCRVVEIMPERGYLSLSEDTIEPMQVKARTMIPQQVWNDPKIIYLGLEIYLSGDCAGYAAECGLTCNLINAIRRCAEEACFN